MNLVRAGHYHTPSGPGEKGSCRTATVTFHSDYDQTPGSADKVWVNLTVWDHDGTLLGNREHVPVAAPTGTRTEDTFHLSGECPWLR